jgi:hypothetical protein
MPSRKLYSMFAAMSRPSRGASYLPSDELIKLAVVGLPGKLAKGIATAASKLPEGQSFSRSTIDRMHKKLTREHQNALTQVRGIEQTLPVTTSPVSADQALAAHGFSSALISHYKPRYLPGVTQGYGPDVMDKVKQITGKPVTGFISPNEVGIAYPRDRTFMSPPNAYVLSHEVGHVTDPGLIARGVKYGDRSEQLSHVNEMRANRQVKQQLPAWREHFDLKSEDQSAYQRAQEAAYRFDYMKAALRTAQQLSAAEHTPQERSDKIRALPGFARRLASIPVVASAAGRRIRL